VNIRVDIPTYLDAEEFAERCENQGIEFRKGKYGNGWCIYVEDTRSENVALLIINTMLKELDKEIEFELEAYRGEG